MGEMKRKLALAKIEQHEPITDYELAEVGLASPNRYAAGWWRDPLSYTWRWVSPTFVERLIGVR